MINTGFHIKQQNLWSGQTRSYEYFKTIYWVQKKVSFLGIPLYIKNLASFGSLESALLYIRSLK
jgi:hypothetical protein